VTTDNGQLTTDTAHEVRGNTFAVASVTTLQAKDLRRDSSVTAENRASSFSFNRQRKLDLRRDGGIIGTSRTGDGDISMIGTNRESFRIESILGSGMSVVVYRGTIGWTKVTAAVKVLSSVLPKTRTSRSLRAPAYISPEQIRGTSAFRIREVRFAGASTVCIAASPDSAARVIRDGFTGRHLVIRATGSCSMVNRGSKGILETGQFPRRQLYFAPSTTMPRSSRLMP
jgi:hypothetical protein